jgi:2-keto-3-deoxy-L-rhamnonate aldolase RhmA
LIAAYQAVGDACRRHGKVLGVGGINDLGDIRRYVGMGGRFLGSGSDHSYIVAAASERVNFIRGLG